MDASITKPWLATYAANSIPAEINPDVFPSVNHMLESAMTKFAGKTAFHSFGQTVTYADMDRLSRDFAAWLVSKGVKKGDRVAVMVPNVMAFPIAFLGIIRAGAVQVNVNPMYTSRELEHQLKDSGSEIIVIFSGATPVLAEIIGKTPVKNVITVELGDGGPMSIPSPSVDPRLASTVKFADALAAGSSLPYSPVVMSGKDLLFLQYTGGTTGVSKGASISHRNMVANIQQYKSLVSEFLREGEEVVVTALPLYHIFALMVNFLTYFTVGAQNWLVANPREYDKFIDILKAARPTIFTGVNTLYAALTMHPRIKEVDLTCLRLCMGGGTTTVGAVSEKWKVLTGAHIKEGYGLSEASPMVSMNPPSMQDFSGSAGLPMPSSDIVLLDEDDKAMGIGEAGEICVKGPQVMSGYWQRPEANETAFTKDGYLRTGDIGMFDDKGFLRIVDRKKDMILVSGFNVYPNEIEEFATTMKGVAECACAGVRDEKTGEAVRLFVVKAPDATITEEEVIAHCRKGLTAYKVPKFVRFVEALPKSGVGKILRRELRDQS